ncbi:hypothetical protein P3T43_001919 [Paraburkholderia sp. GAS41]
MPVRYGPMSINPLAAPRPPERLRYEPCRADIVSTLAFRLQLKAGGRSPTRLPSASCHPPLAPLRTNPKLSQAHT